MKSKAKQKTFINNMITYAIVVVAYIVVQILMGTGHMSSLMKGLLVPFCIYVCRCFFRGIVFKVHEGCY